MAYTSGVCRVSSLGKQFQSGRTQVSSDTTTLHDSNRKTSGLLNISFVYGFRFFSILQYFL
jgi:hypothetical protein